MTANRFRISKVFELNRPFPIYDGDCPLTQKEASDLLNEQHETIERLKQNIDELMQLDVEEDLLKENKELKQSNERLLKMLDNVANYMQKENKYMPIDDFVEWWNGIATKGLDGEDLE